MAPGTTTQIPQIQPGSGPVRMTPPTVRSATLTLDGEVTAIDRENRHVTMRGEDGEQMTMVVGPDIERFEQLEVGDKVQARYTEAVAVALATGGTEADLRQKIESSAVDQPQSGKPGLGAVERTTIVANVFEIDKDAGTVTSSASPSPSAATTESNASSGAAQTRQDRASDSAQRTNDTQTTQREDTGPGVTGALAGPSGDQARR